MGPWTYKVRSGQENVKLGGLGVKSGQRLSAKGMPDNFFF